MQLDGLLFEGTINRAYIDVAIMIGFVFWLLGFVLALVQIRLGRNRFKPQAKSTDNLLATLFSLLIFSLMIIFQLAVESVIIWWDSPMNSLQDMTEVDLRPWIMGHLGLGFLWLVILAFWGHKEIDTFIFQSAFPSAIITVGFVFLGMLWWPSLFSFPLLTSAIMGAQFLSFGIASIPFGFLALYLLAQMFMWAYD